MIAEQSQKLLPYPEWKADQVETKCTMVSATPAFACIRLHSPAFACVKQRHPMTGFFDLDIDGDRA